MRTEELESANITTLLRSLIIKGFRDTGSILKRKNQEKTTTTRRHSNMGEMIALFSAEGRGPGEGQKHLLWKREGELLHNGFG